MVNPQFWKCTWMPCLIIFTASCCSERSPNHLVLENLLAPFSMYIHAYRPLNCLYVSGNGPVIAIFELSEISTPDGWNDWQFFLWIFFFWINHLDSISFELAMNFAIVPGLSIWLHCVVNCCFYVVSWCLFALTHVFRLLTPPGTPLFPSLERESPKTVRSQDGSPKPHPTALKSRVRTIILL